MENKVFKKYINNRQMLDFNYGLNPNVENITEQEFTECAYKQIDLFIKELYESMCLEFANNKAALLCKAIQKVLKDNLYNEDTNISNLFYNMFQIPNCENADFGLTASFSYSYNQNMMGIGKDLIIQIVFEDFHYNESDNMQVFQIRCNYESYNDIYNEDFEEYFESKGFLTTDDYVEYWGREHSEDCEDKIGISIVKLSYCNLYEDLYNGDTLEYNIKTFHDDMSKVIYE